MLHVSRIVVPSSDLNSHTELQTDNIGFYDSESSKKLVTDLALLKLKNSSPPPTAKRQVRFFNPQKSEHHILIR